MMTTHQRLRCTPGAETRNANVSAYLFQLLVDGPGHRPRIEGNAVAVSQTVNSLIEDPKIRHRMLFPSEFFPRPACAVYPVADAARVAAGAAFTLSIVR